MRSEQTHDQLQPLPLGTDELAVICLPGIFWERFDEIEEVQLSSPQLVERGLEEGSACEGKCEDGPEV